MQPNVEEIFAYLTRVRGEVASVIEATPRAKMDRDPGNGKWSGTGIIQHMGKVEGATAKLLEGQFAAAMAAGMPEDTAHKSWINSLDRLNVVDRSRVINAPERLYPEAAADLDASWASLQAVRERLKRAVLSVDGRDLSVVSAPHPIFGPLNAYEWVLMVGKHEERHITQLRQTVA
jgi:hypothetical protein